MLNSSELAEEGFYLKAEGDPLFWALVPDAKGWKLHQSDWGSSDTYVPIDLHKPWKGLTRTSPVSHEKLMKGGPKEKNLEPLGHRKACQNLRDHRTKSND